MNERVYAIWFMDYDDQHIEGNLYRNADVAWAKCVELNKAYRASAPHREHCSDYYSVEEHEIE